MFRDGAARLLVFRVGSERFAVELSAVAEVIATPAHASAIGLLLHGSREGASGSRVIGGAMGDSVAGAIGKMKGWLTRNF